jgi:hypothetical protein
MVVGRVSTRVHGEHHGGCGTTFVRTGVLGFPTTPANGAGHTGTSLGKNGVATG